MKEHRPCPVCGEMTNELLTLAHPEKPMKHTPYWMCERCDTWFQDPMPEKVFEHEGEKDDLGRSLGHQQPRSHLEAAAHLARCFANNWILKPNYPYPYKTLDIGCKYPYFAHTLKKEFGMNAWGIDGMDLHVPGQPSVMKEYQAELDVPMLIVDFEKVKRGEIIEATGNSDRFDAISMIHVFEHIYSPKEGLLNLRDLIKANGVLLLRMPSHDVTGWDQHLTEEHFDIHPFFHSERSIRRIVKDAGCFEIVETYGLPGTGARDFILKPL